MRDPPTAGIPARAGAASCPPATAGERADDRARDAPGWMELALVFLLTGSLMAFVQFASPHLVGTDAYYHLKVAGIVGRTGDALVDFPWAQMSVFRDRFSDSSLLFHVLLAPFALSAHPILAAKIAATLLAGTFLTLFYRFLRVRGCPFALVFLLLLMGSGTLFLFRLQMCRGYLVSMVLALLALEALVARRWLGLFIVSVLYPLSYTAFQIVLVLALIDVVIRGAVGRGLDLRPLSVSGAGVLLGLLVHPDFPDDLSLWWVQNVEVLGLKWLGAVELHFGGELYAPSADTLLRGAGVLLITLIAGVTVAVLSGRPRRDDTLVSYGACVFFGALMLLSRRFVEYAAPFSVAFAALLTRDLFPGSTLERLVVRWPRGSRLVAVAVLSLLGWVLGMGMLRVRRDVARAPPPMKEPVARWLAEHTVPGSRVFTCDWDDLPELFWHNDRNHYLVALDPTFAYMDDPARWARWHRVANGYVPDVYGALAGDFDCRYAFCTPEFALFLRRARADPRIREVVTSPGGVLFELGDDVPFITSFALMGPIPVTPGSRARHDREILRSLAGAGSPDRPWVPYRPPRASAFVDLRALHGEGPLRALFAAMVLETPGAWTGDLRVGFSESLDVWVDGGLVFRRTGGGALVDSHRIPVRLEAGEHVVLLRIEDRGGEWGFFMRVPELPEGTRVGPWERPVPGALRGLGEEGAGDGTRTGVPASDGYESERRGADLEIEFVLEGSPGEAPALDPR